MPYGEPDNEDPMELVGVELPATLDSVHEMVVCFAEEYARSGFNSEQILGLFKNPQYVPAFKALEILGETKVREAIAEAVFIYGRREG